MATNYNRQHYDEAEALRLAISASLLTSKEENERAYILAGDKFHERQLTLAYNASLVTSLEESKERAMHFAMIRTAVDNSLGRNSNPTNTRNNGSVIPSSPMRQEFYNTTRC